MKEPWCDIRNPNLCRTAKDGDISIKRWNLCGKNGRTFNLVNFSLSVKNVNKQYCNNMIVKWIVSDSAVLLGTYCYVLYFALMYCDLCRYK